MSDNNGKNGYVRMWQLLGVTLTGLTFMVTFVLAMIKPIEATMESNQKDIEVSRNDRLLMRSQLAAQSETNREIETQFRMGWDKQTYIDNHQDNERDLLHERVKRLEEKLLYK